MASPAMMTLQNYWKGHGVHLMGQGSRCELTRKKAHLGVHTPRMGFRQKPGNLRCTSRLAPNDQHSRALAALGLPRLADFQACLEAEGGVLGERAGKRTY
eukprot:1142854-Pelagomonas_calceolata.AAC.10